MRGLFIIFIVFLLFSTIVYSAETISVVENPQVQKESTGIKGFLKRNWVFILLIFVCLALLLWFLIWLVGKIKEGRDVWFQIWKHKKHLCKIHRDKWRNKAFFKFRKNSPIRIVYQDNNNVHSKVVGHYKGHYLSHEGNVTILFNCRRKWLIFPKNELLIVNTNPDMIFYETKQVIKGNKMETERVPVTTKLPNNFVSFNSEDIIIQAFSIDMDVRTNFYYPVLKDKNGKIINMFFPTFETMKQVVIESYLFDQTDDFVKVTKKSIDLNPLIRGHNKVLDNSASIETQESQMKR